MRRFATSLFVIAVSSTAASAADLPAFPGAEGFGALATGGRGGEIVRVITLNDAGPGSFRDAVSKPKRIVVFAVGGTVELKSNLSIPSNITVLGQTAPGEGICFYGKSLSISNSSNLILQYLRAREGISGDRGKCSINASDASNFIIDHCSIQWGRWDCLGITSGSHDGTLQNCIVGEGLDPQRFGALVDTVENITLAGNLWINNHSRNPKAKGTIQYINNVVYNWRITGLCGGHSAADHSLDVIGNYFIKGPTSNNRAVGQCSETDHVFSAGNKFDLSLDGTLNGRDLAEADFKESQADREAGEADPAAKGDAPTFIHAAWGKPKIPVTLHTADEAYDRAVAQAGCSFKRDAVDIRLIAELTSLGKSGKVIDKEADVGGLPLINGGTAPADTDQDGIPDAWESAHGLNPNDKSDASRIDPATGYMQIERYAQAIVAAQ